MIKLDDKSHNREDRIERDGIVEGILKDAEMPLLRFENHGSFSKDEIEITFWYSAEYQNVIYLSMYLSLSSISIL